MASWHIPPIVVSVILIVMAAAVAFHRSYM